MRLSEIVSEWGVFDKLGECYALCLTAEEAAQQLLQGALYLDEAANSGHSRAVSWVDERRPLRIHAVGPEWAAAIRENGAPILEREP